MILCACFGLGVRSLRRHEATVRGVTPPISIAAALSSPRTDKNSVSVIMSKSIYTNRVILQLVSSNFLHKKLNDNRTSTEEDASMDFKMESGRRLRRAREAKNLKLAELAALVDGVGVSRISNYEQGLRLMRQPEAIKLAQVLDVSPAYLMCIDEDSKLPPKIKRLIEMYEAADSRGKKTIELVAESQASMNIKHLSYLQSVNN